MFSRLLITKRIKKQHSDQRVIVVFGRSLNTSDIMEMDIKAEDMIIKARILPFYSGGVVWQTNDQEYKYFPHGQ